MGNRIYHRDHSLPKLRSDGSRCIFVFGSNLQGIHGSGAARVALEKFGAVYGNGRGRMALCYALPTKSTPYKSLTLDEVRDEVDTFIEYAKSNPKEFFFVTRIGCVLAGFSDEQIAPLFVKAPLNCSFAKEWREYLD